MKKKKLKVPPDLHEIFNANQHTEKKKTRVTEFSFNSSSIVQLKRNSLERRRQTVTVIAINLCQNIMNIGQENSTQTNLNHFNARNLEDHNMIYKRKLSGSNHNQ
jgi:hypothetical protein